ncbi:MAG: hypothetical protein GX061_03550 [Eubacteriaceae bacterium]|nr:hypothetical protein [Eubacteriaceae bacterium]
MVSPSGRVALPEGFEGEDTGGFEITELPCGLYAVAPCLDGAADWEKTRGELTQWANDSELFKPYENAPGKKERYPLFHIVTPGRLMAKGISVEDLYLPIEER